MEQANEAKASATINVNDTSNSQIDFLRVAVLSEISGQFENSYRRGLRDIAEYGHGYGQADDPGAGGGNGERALPATGREGHGPVSPSTRSSRTYK